LLPISGTYIAYATATEPVPMPSPAGSVLVDQAAQARAALEVASLSSYLAWKFVDRVGLIMALGVGLLGAFVWQRDRRWEVVDLLHTQPVSSWHYVGGKCLGLVLTWGGLLLVLGVVVGGQAAWRAAQAGIPFVWADFMLPAVGVVGSTLLYGTALLLLLSLLLRNGVAALLLYVAYWAYSMTSVSGIVEVVPLRRLTSWMLRFDFVAFTPESYHLLQEHLSALWWHRVLYLALTSVLLALTIVVYQRMWTHSGQIHTTDQPTSSALPPWRRWFRRRMSQ
jgi:ABC-type transport system involved in multi-copper enzyme maturation permease subunit